MAKQVTLAAQKRTHAGRSAVRKIKAQGYVPAVVYSRGQAPLPLQVLEREMDTLLAHAVGEHFLVDLAVAGESGQLAIVKEVQHHPVTRAVLHVDFHGVSADEALESSIPVEPVGEADGVKNGGGLLEQLVRAVTVSCLPKDLPESLKVDVSALKIGEAIHVKDLPLPAGVTAVSDPELAVFLVAEPTVAAEPVAAAAAAEAAAAGPEVIKEKKPAEGEAPKDEKKEEKK